MFLKSFVIQQIRICRILQNVGEETNTKIKIEIVSLNPPLSY